MHANAAMTVEEIRSLPALIGRHDAARLLGIHPRTVADYAHDGKLPGTKIAGKWRFPTAKLIEMCGLEVGRDA